MREGHSCAEQREAVVYGEIRGGTRHHYHAGTAGRLE